MFEFYSYIKPDEYRFLAAPPTSRMRLIDFRSVPKTVQALLDWDVEYDDPEAHLADAAFQLWQRGYGLFEEGELTYLPTDLYIRNVADNYRFIARFFGRRWLHYISYLRYQEGHAWWGEWKLARKVSQRVSRVSLQEGFVSYEALKLKKDELKDLSVSVIIATRNRHEFLHDILQDLSQQWLLPQEVIVVDQSDEPYSPFSIRCPFGLEIIHQPEAVGQWSARNLALSKARGRHFAMVDDDVRLHPHWLMTHLAMFRDSHADIVTGMHYPARRFHQDITRYAPTARFASQFNASNAYLTREAYQALGPFDVSYDGQRWGDHAYGLRAYQAGLTVVSNPFAAVFDQKAPHGGLREGPHAGFLAQEGLTRHDKLGMPSVARYFRAFPEIHYSRWRHTKGPWQRKGKWGIWWRLFRYWWPIISRKTQEKVHTNTP